MYQYRKSGGFKNNVSSEAIYQNCKCIKKKTFNSKFKNHRKINIF